MKKLRKKRPKKGKIEEAQKFILPSERTDNEVKKKPVQEKG
jgi:hypothetical protein